MTTLKISDQKDFALAFDLHDLLQLLSPRSLQAMWTVSPVKYAHPDREFFEATGVGGERLEALAEKCARLSGPDLLAIAKDTRQVIWGEFVGSLASLPDEKWVTIRAIDSSFYEIETLDEAVLKEIKSAFNNVYAHSSQAKPRAE